MEGRNEATYGQSGNLSVPCLHIVWTNKGSSPRDELPRVKVKRKQSFKPLLFLYILISSEDIGQGFN